MRFRRVIMGCWMGVGKVGAGGGLRRDLATIHYILAISRLFMATLACCFTQPFHLVIHTNFKNIPLMKRAWIFQDFTDGI